MTDEQLKTLADLVITQGEQINALITAYKDLHEEVAPLLPQNERVLNTTHHFEQLEAICEKFPEAVKQTREYFGLPPL